MVDSLKALDPNRPIREADIPTIATNVRFRTIADKAEFWGRDGLSASLQHVIICRIVALAATGMINRAGNPVRLKDKIAIVVGAGQSPGEGMGNGRATVLRFVQEGAMVMAVDRDLASVEETVAMARAHGPCVAFEADVTKEKMLAAMVAAAQEKFGRIDVLHYNVGLSISGGDAPPTEITEEAFDRIVAINLRGCVMAVKHVLPVMRAQRTGVILTISSVAAYENYPYVAYKATKAGMIAFTQQVAIQNAEYGIRANCICRD